MHTLKFTGYIFNFFICLISLFIHSINTQFPFNVSIIILLPLSYQIANTLIKKKTLDIYSSFLQSSKQTEGKLLYDQIEENFLSISKLDFYLRSIFEDTKIEYSQYLNSPESVILENISASHKKFCITYPNCFCAQNLTREEQEQNDTRQFYLNDYIEKSYSMQTEKQTSIFQNITFSYIMFIIDIKSKETKSMTLALKLFNNQDLKMSLIQRQKVHTIVRFINDKVQLQEKSIVQKRKIGNKLNLIENINFDQKLLSSSVLLGQCLDLKPQALFKIGQNHVNIQEVHDIFQKLRNERERLSQSFKQLIVLYHESILLSFMIELFENSLSFDFILSRKLRSLKKSSSTIKENSQNNTIKLNSYSEDSCVIFISLLQKTGTITKVSKNLFQVVPIFSSEEAIGKNINFMMAPGIAKFHDKIILNFLEKQQVSSLVTDFPLLIGQDKQGWAIPYQLKLQICLISTQDFGVCGWIKQVQNSSLYILANLENNYEVYTVSKLFFEVILQDIITKKMLTSLCLSSLIPTLPHFLQKGWSEMNPSYETVIFKPSDEDFCSSDINFEEKSSLISDLFEMEMYKIKSDYFPQSTKFTKFLQVKVNFMSKLDDNVEKCEGLKILLNDFEQFGMYNTAFIDQQKKVLADLTSKSVNEEQRISQSKRLQNKEEGLETIPSQADEKSIGGRNMEISNVFVNNNNISSRETARRMAEQIKEIDIQEDNQLILLQSLTKAKQVQNLYGDQNLQNSNFDKKEFNIPITHSNLGIISSNLISNNNNNIDLTISVNNQNINSTLNHQNNLNISFDQSHVMNNYANQSSTFNQNFNYQNIYNTLNVDNNVNNMVNQASFYRNNNNQSSFQEKLNIKQELDNSSKINLKNHLNYSKFQEINQESFYELHIPKNKELIAEKHSEQLISIEPQIINSENELKKYDTQLLSQVYSEKLLSSPVRGIDGIDYQDMQLYPASSPKPLLQHDSSTYSNSNFNQISNDKSTSFLKSNKIISKNSFYPSKKHQYSKNTFHSELTSPSLAELTLKKLMMKSASVLAADHSQAVIQEEKKKQLSSNTVSNQCMIQLSEFSQPQNETKKKNTQNESSIESSKAVSSSFRAMVYSIIKQQKYTQLNSFKYFGLLLLIGVLTLYLYQYLILNTQLVDQRECFPLVEWSSQVRLTTFLMTGDQNFNVITTQFPEFGLPDPVKQAEWINRIKTLQNYRYKKVQYYLALYYRTIQTSATIFYNVIQNQTMIFKYAFTPSRYASLLLPFSYGESHIFAFIYYVAYYLPDPDERDELQILINFQSTVDVLQNIDNLVYAGLSEMYDGMKRDALIALIIGLVVSFFTSASLLPLYFYVQQKRQEILTLLSTLSPEKLEELVNEAIETKQTVEYEIWRKFQVKIHSVGLKKSSSNKTFVAEKYNKQTQLIQKKKNLSSTTSLPKFKFKILFLATIFLFQSVIYSFSSFIGLGQFFTIQEENRELIDSMNQIHQLFNRVIGVRGQLVRFKLQDNDTLFQSYLKGANKLQATVPSMLQNYYQVTTKQQGLTRYMKEEFDDVIIAILEGNVCDTLQKYIQYQVSGFFDYQECISLHNNLFANGLITVSKFYFLFFDQIMLKLTVNDRTLMRDNAMELQSVFSMYEAFVLRIYYSFVMDTVRTLIKKITDLHYAYFTQLIMILFLLQVLSFTISTYFIYLKVYKQCLESITETKKLIDVIDIHVLAESQYLVSYLNSQK